MSRQSEPRRLTVTRFVDPRTGARVPKGTPGAKRVKEKTDTYYVMIGKKRVSLKTSDKREAWARYRDLLRQHADRAAGITDQYTEQAARALETHIQDWTAALLAKGTCAKHVGILAMHVRAVAAAAGWRRLNDMTEDTAAQALAAVIKDGGLSAQTRNHYLGHLQQFCRWCKKGKRLRDNPVEELAPISVEADRRHTRRCPADEEMASLFAYLEGAECKTRWKMTGRHRALGYRVAAATGFRAQELRSLTRESFDLDAGVVYCKAGYDKRRRLVRQEIPPWLVEQLRAWFDQGGECWEKMPWYHPGRVLQKDLADAGVEYETVGPDGPLYFDMHALRVWYITQLAHQPGISPQVLMEKARHSNPTLTMKIYAKSRPEANRAAIEQIKEPGK